MSKTISNNSLTLKLPEAVITDGTNKKPTKNFQEKLGNEMPIEKLAMHMCKAGHLPRNYLRKPLISHLGLT